MRRSAVSVRRAAPAALAILFGALLLVSFVVDGVRKAAPPAAIGGRRMMLGGGAGGLRTLEDFKAHDPFQDSKRRVPNGPDPIHNRYLDFIQIIHCTASLVMVFEFVPLFPCHERNFVPLFQRSSSCYLCTSAQVSWT